MHLKDAIKQFCVIHQEVELSSGQKSNYYIDMKRLTYSSYLYEVVRQMYLRFKGFTAVGGPANGVNPIVAGFCCHYILNGFVVEKEPKKHGLMQHISGNLSKTDKILLVEDVTTTGASIMKAKHTILGYYPDIQFVGACSIVDREQGAKDNINIPFQSLFTKSELGL